MRVSIKIFNSFEYLLIIHWFFYWYSIDAPLLLETMEDDHDSRIADRNGYTAFDYLDEQDPNYRQLLVILNSYQDAPIKEPENY